jgi:hypothetical protein
MNTKTILIFVTMAVALAVVAAPTLMRTAAAAPDTACINPGGKVPKGQEEPDTPPGQADCPNDQFTKKNEQAIK